MLEDRPYMRDSYDQRRTGVLVWLICAITAVFVIQLIGSRIPGIIFDLEDYLGFSSVTLRSGHIWTLLTYGFFHSTLNLLQVIGYLLAIYFFGREIVPVIGERRFLYFYGAALVAGALAFAPFHWRHPEMLLGASAPVSAIVILFACFYPEREIMLLLFFVLPVTIKPKYVAYAMVAIDSIGLLYTEILGYPSVLGAAHSAHLGGMLVGWCYFRFVHDSSWASGGLSAEVEMPRWLKRRAAAKAAPAAPYKVNMTDRSNLRAEVDRILDKINSQGFGSLSAAEKKVLDEARDLIGKR